MSTAAPIAVEEAESSRTRFIVRHADLTGIVLVILLTAAIAWDGLQNLRWLRRIDVITFFVPMWDAMGDQIRSGQLPGWLPAQFGGAPLAGDPQSSWLYFPVMILFTALPGVTAYKGLVLFYLLAAGLASYGLARSFGMGVPAAIFVAVAYEFTGVYPQTRCCPIFSSVAIFLPIAFLCFERSTRREDWRGRIAWWALTGAAASQFMTAWVGQGAYYGALALASFIAYRTVLTRNVAATIKERIVVCAIAGIGVFTIAVLVGAGGIWTKIDAVNESQLAGGVYGGAAADAAETAAWTAKEGLANLLSFSARQGRYYMGGVVVALAFIAPALAGLRRHVPYFYVFSIVVFVMTLSTTPIHQLFYLWPKFETLHEHVRSRILLLLPLGLAMLAGASLDALLRFQAKRPVALMAVIPFFFLYMTHHGLDSPVPIDNRTIVLGGIATAVIVVFVLGGNWLRTKRLQPVSHLLVGLLIVVAFLDPSGWNVGLRSVLGEDLKNDYTDEANALIDGDYLHESGAVAFLKTQEALPDAQPFRYFGYDQGLIWKNGRSTGGYYTSYVSVSGRAEIAWLLTLNQASRFGLQDVQGYNPIQNLRYNEFIEAVNGRSQNYHSANILGVGLDSPLLNLLNARYIVVPRDVPAGRPDLLHLSQQLKTVYSDEHVRILDNPAAFPRTWIVHTARVGPREWVLNEIETAPPDFRQTVLLEEKPPELESGSGNESATVTDYESNKIEINATASAAGMLVLSEVYDPGWKAYVDGKQVDLYEANYAFRAVPIPAGDHQIELRYEPASLRIGFLISTFSILGLLGYFAYLGWRKLRSHKIANV